jgi:hypothetical protein
MRMRMVGPNQVLHMNGCNCVSGFLVVTEYDAVNGKKMHVKALPAYCA